MLCVTSVSRYHRSAMEALRKPLIGTSRKRYWEKNLAYRLYTNMAPEEVFECGMPAVMSAEALAKVEALAEEGYCSFCYERIDYT